jgi:hypothetical protein
MVKQIQIVKCYWILEANTGYEEGSVAKKTFYDTKFWNLAHSVCE